MSVKFSRRAWEDYLYWQQTDPKAVVRIHQLIKDILRSPYAGIGKAVGLSEAAVRQRRRVDPAGQRANLVDRVLDGTQRPHADVLWHVDLPAHEPQRVARLLDARAAESGFSDFASMPAPACPC